MNRMEDKLTEIQIAQISSFDNTIYGFCTVTSIQRIRLSLDKQDYGFCTVTGILEYTYLWLCPAMCPFITRLHLSVHCGTASIQYNAYICLTQVRCDASNSRQT
jgi:hypothetical protein